jgi:hypothetical protein
MKELDHHVFKNEIYPFIDEMVDTFYTKECNELIGRAIESETDKSTFMMFIMMYFGIHLKLETQDDDIKKSQIKMLLTDLIKDHEKRRLCIEMFQTKFQNLFLESSSSSKTNNNLLIKDK